MTLWFDVTDLQHWSHPHLTGIQRTSVSVLSELLAIRKDVRLFAYDHSKKVLRKADVHSLPAAVRDYVISAQQSELASPNGVARAAPNSAFSRTVRGTAVRTVRHLTAGLRRQPRKWVGHEVTDAFKDFLRSSRKLLRAVWRGIFSKGRTAQSMIPAALGEVPPESMLFSRGDVCISLSATWGLQNYGDMIAAHKRRSGAKCINIIYDLIPTLFPQWVLPGQSHFITLWARQQIENADTVLAISKFQKEEISKYIADERLPPRSIDVIHLGDNPRLMTAGTAGESLPLPRYVPERGFAICVSTLDVRKNQGLLYHVWRRLAEELGANCPQLLLIGTPHLHVSDLLFQIRNDPLVNRLVVHLHNVSDEELAWYYRNCQFTIYPSLYEGWGLPISESLSLGKYCIAGNKTSLPEAGGDLVDYFDPVDFVGCHKLVHRAATDPDYIRQREQRVRENYKPYTWAMTAAHISEIVDQVANPEPEESNRRMK